MIKEMIWEKAVQIAFEIVTKDFKLAFKNRNKEINEMNIGERQQFYARCGEVSEGGALQTEAEAVMQRVYTEAALGELSKSERISRKYLIVSLGELLKRMHALGAKSKLPNVDLPLDQQIG